MDRPGAPETRQRRNGWRPVCVCWPSVVRNLLAILSRAPLQLRNFTARTPRVRSHSDYYCRSLYRCGRKAIRGKIWLRRGPYLAASWRQTNRLQTAVARADRRHGSAVTPARAVAAAGAACMPRTLHSLEVLGRHGSARIPPKTGSGGDAAAVTPSPRHAPPRERAAARAPRSAALTVCFCRLR